MKTILAACNGTTMGKIQNSAWSFHAPPLSSAFLSLCAPGIGYIPRRR